MNPLSREELIELGVSVPADSLIEWAARQLAATKGREARLQSRGVEASTLAAIHDLIESVEKSHQGLGPSEDPSPGAAALALLIRDEAAAFWREAKLIARAGFGTRPDLLAEFRTGVHTGLLLANLTRELESILPPLRAHSSQLAGLGATEAFVAKGERLVGRLKEAKANLDAACLALPAPAAQQCHDKGLLYDLTRRLVRVGQLEFMTDSKQSKVFNFSGVRRKRGVSTAPRLRKERVGGQDPVRSGEAQG